jgi:hypothetical protein
MKKSRKRLRVIRGMLVPAKIMFLCVWVLNQHELQNCYIHGHKGFH